MQLVNKRYATNRYQEKIQKKKQHTHSLKVIYQYRNAEPKEKKSTDCYLS